MRMRRSTMTTPKARRQKVCCPLFSFHFFATQLASAAATWIKGALIGAGSFGKVYLGMDASTGLLMAVKQVELRTNEEHKKSMLSALEREIKLLQDLQHKNLVQYFCGSRMFVLLWSPPDSAYLDSSLDDDFLNIFLEYVPGGSVTALLRNYGAFEKPLAKNFVRQILEGLNYLHERDIIHRDLKGTNILIDNKGGIKISDIGISMQVKDGASTARDSLPRFNSRLMLKFLFFFD